MKSLLFLLLVLPFVFTQTCSTFSETSCSNCTANANCGWCTTTQQCVDGTVVGPSTGYCLGQAWIFGQLKCPNCEDFSDCRECMLHVSDCAWCNSNTSSGGCKPWSYFKAGFGRCKPVTQCDCSIYSNCGDCTSGSNCHWCEKEATCQSVDASCPIGPAFNKSVNCPCSSNTDCFSCKSDFSCQWCNNLGSCRNRGDSLNGTCQVSLGSSCDSFCRLNGNSSCLSCSNLNGCGWCSGSGKCTDVAHASCPIAHTCAGDCNQHRYCDPCLDNPSCSWCDSDNTCKPKGADCAFPSHSCPSYCSAFSSCDTCNARNGCGWCRGASGGPGACLDVDKVKCSTIWVHGCDPEPVIPTQKGGFDGGSFVGGMFLVIGVIALVGLAFLVYRWKTGRKILYTELR